MLIWMTTCEVMKKHFKRLNVKQLFDVLLQHHLQHVERFFRNSAHA
jgi:hypothetical protein